MTLRRAVWPALALVSLVISVVAWIGGERGWVSVLFIGLFAFLLGAMLVQEFIARPLMDAVTAVLKEVDRL